MSERCYFARRPARRRGYVLIMTLVLITLTGVALSRAVQHSLHAAIAATDRQTELQRKWALIGLRQVVLARAEEIIAAQATRTTDGKRHWPEPASVELELPLGRLVFHMLLADEDAKANLNYVEDRATQSTDELGRIIRRLDGLKSVSRSRSSPITGKTMSISWYRMQAGARCSCMPPAATCRLVSVYGQGLAILPVGVRTD